MQRAESSPYILAYAAAATLCVAAGIAAAIGYPSIFQLGLGSRSRAVMVYCALLVFLASAIAIIQFRRHPEGNVSPIQFGLIGSFIGLNILPAVLPAVREAVSTFEFSLILFWVLAILLVQGIVLTLIARLGHMQVVIAGALFTAINILGLFFVFHTPFHYLPPLLQWVVMAAAAAAGALTFLLTAKGIGLSAQSFISVLAVMLVAGASGAIARAGTKDGSQALPVADLHAEFKTKPDVHILTIEALQPVSLLGKEFGVSELPIDRVMAERKFHVFKNAFTRFPSTALSLNSLPTLDTAADVPNIYFSGIADSPLYEAFRDNGYRVITGYANSYLGTKGRYVDAFVPERGDIANSTVCKFTIPHPLRLFGICNVANVFRQWFAPKQQWRDRYIEIMSNLPSDQPVFTFHHTVKPGHTGHIIGNYDHANPEHRSVFAATYLEKLKLASETLDKTVDILIKRGRPFILLVVGDHGAWLSRAQNSSFEDPFVVRDRHGTMAALLTHNVSTEGCDLEAYSPGFTTAARIMSGVLQCLSKSPLPEIPFQEPADFAKFAYE